MFSPHTINAEHRDLIHDVAFNHYGSRMATCSSDQCVKVWDKDTNDTEWVQTALWKAHSGSVWKVTWAHPEFGQVLATCSFDRTVAVWEEIVSETVSVGAAGMRHWVRRTNLVDSRTSVTDVKFAPKTLGLVLATCSVDGIIRIYEAPDIMNLSQWTLQHEVVFKLQCSCISWNPAYSRERRSNKSKIKIPPNSERKDLGCMPEDFDRSALKCILPLEKNDAYVVVPQVPMLAVGSDDISSGTLNKIAVLQYSEFVRKWVKIDNFSGVNDPVHDIAFAPRLGRSYDLMAVASKDVRIFTLTKILDIMGLLRYEVQLSACFEDHNSSVWRVSWNVVGSILASSGDDGCVRMWRALYEGGKLNKKRDINNSIGKLGTSGETIEADKPNKTPTTSDFCLLTQSLKSVWACGAVIKGDGRLLVPSDNLETASPIQQPTITARYFKLTTSQLPRH